MDNLPGFLKICSKTMVKRALESFGVEVIDGTNSLGLDFVKKTELIVEYRPRHGGSTLETDAFGFLHSQ